MSARIAPYQKTLTACFSAAVFGPLVNLLAAVVWFFFVQIFHVLWDNTVNRTELMDFFKENEATFGIVSWPYFAILTYGALLVLAAIFPRANFKSVAIVYVLTTAAIFLILAKTGFQIAQAASEILVAIAATALMPYAQVSQLVPYGKTPPGIGGPTTDATMQDGTLQPQEGTALAFTEKLTRSRKIDLQNMFLLCAVPSLMFSGLFLWKGYLLTAFGILAFCLMVSIVLYLGWQRLAKRPETLIIDEQGLSFARGRLPWPNIKRVWVASEHVVRIETDRQTAQVFHDREHAKPHWSSALLVAIERIWAGINSIPIHVANIEASAGEIVAAIKRARPREETSRQTTADTSPAGPSQTPPAPSRPR